MTCCNSSNKVISVYKGFGTKWNGENLLNVSFDTQISLEDFKAEFRIGDIVKIYDDIKDGFAINLTAQETATLPVGPTTGTFILIDMENNKRPFTTELPFLVKDWEDGDVELDGFKISVDAKVQENILNIRIETESADAAIDNKIRAYIAIHNASEEAHPYIQELVNLEKNRAEGIEGELRQAIEQTAESIKDGVLTIQKNGTTVQTFSANQSSNVTANLVIPTKTSDITNDSDFATNSGVTTAISNHNTSESAHSYIQGLISAEKNRAEGVEGTLSNLTTDSKISLVSAINEVDSHTDANTSNIGNLSNLTTSEKSTLVGAINEVDSIAETALQPSDVVDAVDSTETQKPLSANMGKELQDEIDNLKARGRFLALWDCSTGLAESDPPVSPYIYQAGDYFIVGIIASGSGTNYKPSGSSYTTGVASTTVETETVDVDDVYYYDGNVWRLQVNTQKTVSFVNIAGDPYDNSNLAAAFNQKQNTITGGASTITSSNLTANRALISNAQGKVAVSPVTNTELGYLSGTTSAVQTQLNNKASTSLDNLSSTGQMIIDSQNGTISNCILEIPQDINLTLSGTTLTLKSGSKVWVPTSSGAIQQQLTEDAVAPFITTGTDLVFRAGTSLLTMPKQQCYSGDTAPSANQYMIWYDTANNRIKYTADYGSTWLDGYNFPVALVTRTSNNEYSIDQVFNGAGYIGHHAFILPDVKALIPDGFNTDGSLKNIEYSRDNLSVYEMILPSLYTGYRTFTLYRPSGSGIYSSVYAGEVEDVSQAQQYGQWYIKNKNMVMQYNSTTQQFDPYTGVYFLKYIYDGTSVTKFDIRQVVRLATTEMLDKKQDILTSITGYDVNETQTLKNINGTLTWVTD